MFAEVLEQVKENLSPDRGEAYCSAIVALGHIAFHLPDTFPVHIKNIVSRKIVKELIMKDQSEVTKANERSHHDRAQLQIVHDWIATAKHFYLRFVNVMSWTIFGGRH